MADIIAITAVEFARNFDRHELEVQQRPIAITSLGHTSGYFVSTREYAELQRLRALERRPYRSDELPAHIADAIDTARMGEVHEQLNDLLEKG
jgi:hypothetical protein